MSNEHDVELSAEIMEAGKKAYYEWYEAGGQDDHDIELLVKKMAVALGVVGCE